MLIYISLGFVAASLLAVLLNKLVFKKAYKKAAKDLRGQIPLNQAEMQAERDRLRAEYAVNLNKLEFKVAAMQEAELNMRIESSQAQEFKLQSTQSLDKSIKQAVKWEQAHIDAQNQIAILRNKLNINNEMLADMQLNEAKHQVEQQIYDKAKLNYEIADSKYLKVKNDRDEIQRELKTNIWQLSKITNERELQDVELQAAQKNNIVYEAKISEISTQLLFLGQELFAKKISLDLSEKAVDKYKNKLLVQKIAMRDASIKDKAIYAIKTKLNGTSNLDLEAPDRAEKPEPQTSAAQNSINTNNISINSPAPTQKPTLVHDINQNNLEPEVANVELIDPQLADSKLGDIKLADSIQRALNKTAPKADKPLSAAPKTHIETASNPINSVTGLRDRMNIMANGTDD